MWRLFLALALGGASLVQGEGRGVPCSSIATFQNLSLAELQGSWVARKSLHKTAAMVLEATVCIVYHISDTSDNGLQIDANYHIQLPSGDVDEDTVRMGLKVIGDNRGRWSVKADKRHLQGAEMLLLSFNSSSYFVIGLCTLAEQAEGQMVSDGSGERFLSGVAVHARRQGPGDSGHLSGEDLAKVLGEVTQTLGLQSFYKEVTYYTDC